MMPILISVSDVALCLLKRKSIVLSALAMLLNGSVCKMIYFIARGEEDWTGGLIIRADNEEEAIQIYDEYPYEDDDGDWHSIEDLTQEKGVIYDDNMR